MTEVIEHQGIHHLGILVRDAEDAAERFRQTLGWEVDRWEDFGPGILRIAFIRVGRILVELVQPLTEDFNAEWLRRHGEGVQHIALHVEDVERSMAELKRQGVPLREEQPRPGAGNTLITFLAEEFVGGLMLELTQPLEGR